MDGLPLFMYTVSSSIKFFPLCPLCLCGEILLRKPRYHESFRTSRSDRRWVPKTPPTLRIFLHSFPKLLEAAAEQSADGSLAALHLPSDRFDRVALQVFQLDGHALIVRQLVERLG